MRGTGVYKRETRERGGFFYLSDGETPKRKRVFLHPTKKGKLGCTLLTRGAQTKNLGRSSSNPTRKDDKYTNLRGETHNNRESRPQHTKNEPKGKR